MNRIADFLVDTSATYYLETYDDSLLCCLVNGIYEPILEEAEQTITLVGSEESIKKEKAGINAINQRMQDLNQQYLDIMKGINKNRNELNQGFFDRIIAKLKEWINWIRNKLSSNKNENNTAVTNQLKAAENKFQNAVNQAEHKQKEVANKSMTNNTSTSHPKPNPSNTNQKSPESMEEFEKMMEDPEPFVW